MDNLGISILKQNKSSRAISTYRHFICLTTCSRLIQTVEHLFNHGAHRCLTLFPNHGIKLQNELSTFETFSLQTWKALSHSEQGKHTLSTCRACYVNHGDIQQYFPLKPVYVPESTVEVIGGQEKAAAQRLIHDANIEWEEYGHKLMLFPSCALR